jgi:enoyl-CoA hydratase/carnithine racemase
MNGDAGFTAVLTGKNFRAKDAAAIHMVDAVIPAAANVEQYAEAFLRETLPSIDRTPPDDLANAENLVPMVLPMVQKATMGRPNPRAPYVALDLMAKGAALPLQDAINERGGPGRVHLGRGPGRHALLLHPAVCAEAAEVLPGKRAR